MEPSAPAGLDSHKPRLRRSTSQGAPAASSGLGAPRTLTPSSNALQVRPIAEELAPRILVEPRALHPLQAHAPSIGTSPFEPAGTTSPLRLDGVAQSWPGRRRRDLSATPGVARRRRRPTASRRLEQRRALSTVVAMRPGVSTLEGALAMEDAPRLLRRAWSARLEVADAHQPQRGPRASFRLSTWYAYPGAEPRPTPGAGPRRDVPRSAGIPSRDA